MYMCVCVCVYCTISEARPLGSWLTIQVEVVVDDIKNDGILVDLR